MPDMKFNNFICFMVYIIQTVHTGTQIHSCIENISISDRALLLKQKVLLLILL